MAVLYRHWKLTVFNALLVVFTIVAILVYLVRAPVPKARADQSNPSNSSYTLDASDYGRMIKLRNSLCLTDVDLAVMNCSQTQASGIITSLVNWYQSNSASWDTLEQQKISARQQLQTAHQSITGAGDPNLWQQMAAARDQIEAANNGINQLMQGASSGIAAQLSSAQQTLWTTIQANVALRVPAQFRYAPNLNAQQAFALASAISKRQSNVASLLSSDQAQANTANLQTAAQNTAAMIALDNSMIPPPTPTTRSTTASAHYNFHAQ